MALIREHSNFFGREGLHIIYYCLYIILALPVIYIIYKRRGTLRVAGEDFITRPSYGFFVSGFFTVLIFSRLMGVPQLWRTILKEKYVRVVERCAEESIENFGYSLLLIGTLEYVLSLNKQSKSK